MANEYRSSWAYQAQMPAPLRVDAAESARLGWWVLLAILLSMLVHIFLIIAFDIIKVKQFVPASLLNRDAIAFQSSRVTISKSALEEILPVPAPSVEDMTPPEDASPLLDESINEFEMQELLSDLEVKLTPAVTEATRVLAEDAPPVEMAPVAPVTGEAASAAVPEIVRTDDSSLKNQLLAATRASENQPLLELDLGPAREDRDGLIRIGSETDASDGEVVEGFSNLSQLLTQTGPLGDNTKPILMPTDLLFEYDSYTLREDAKLSLMRLGILIQRNPDSEFVIEGHTDTRGTVEYNQVLSERRAYAVRDWLIHSLRIDANNLRAVGRGKSNPLVNPNGEIEEQALNRRVEIIINKRGALKTRP